MSGHVARSTRCDSADTLQMVQSNPMSRVGVSCQAELIVFARALLRISRAFFGRNWNQGKALVRIFCGVMLVCRPQKLI